MKHENIKLRGVQIIGMSKEIAFNNPSECSKFWGEYVERIVKPVYIEGKKPDEFQKAAVENNVGEFGLCTCRIPNHNCGTCGATNFTACNTKTFTYVIGGMSAFQQQYAKFHDEWLPAHPEFRWADNACSLEWYSGADINSPDYQCGIMMPLAD